MRPSSTSFSSPGRKSGKNEIVAALCSLQGDQGKRLFAFSSPEDEENLNQIAERFSAGSPDSGPEALLKRAASLRRIAPQSLLNDIHPGWLLEVLEGESPRVIGVMCRFLSGDKVRYILDRLSPEIRVQMPTVNESYFVSSAVADIVRSSIEKRFSFPETAPEGAFSFSHIVLMKGDDLRALFRDLGLEEIRKAFHKVEPDVLRAFLTRFHPKLAREIRERIDHPGSVAPAARAEAQKHVVSLPLDRMPVEDILRDIGYSFFAQAVEETEVSWMQALCLRLAPEEGYRLKRFLRDYAGKRSQGAIASKREEILKRISILMEKGIVKRYWKAAPVMSKPKGRL